MPVFQLEKDKIYFPLPELGEPDGLLAIGGDLSVDRLLYGVNLGHCFFGESMYSDMENGSKLALIALAQLLKEHNYNMIDCQFHTDHLESMGGVHISYEEYRKLLPS